MAAAEYYNPTSGGDGGGGGPSLQQHYPVQAPQSHPSQQHLNPPYPISDAPPPYSEVFANSPQPQQRPLHQNNQYRPHPSSSPQYPPEKPSRPIQIQPNSSSPNSYSSSGYPSSHPSSQSYQPPRPQFAPQSSQSGLLKPGYDSANDPRRPSSTPAAPRGILKNKHEQSPYRSRSRSRSSSRERRRDRSHSRHRRAHHHHHHSQHLHPSASRPDLARKKDSSNSVKTFLGAGGGAIMGDLIFPGLGTIGGAILGGLGGHELGKRKDTTGGSGSGSGSAGYRSQRTRSYSNGEGDYEYYEGRRGRRY